MLDDVTVGKPDMEPDRLTGYGVIGIVVMLILALSLINWLFPDL